METRIAVFKGKSIRKTLFNDEWWFVIEDIVIVLTDSSDPKQYIQRMKQRDPELSKGWVQIVHTLVVDTEGGQQKMLCANTFKRWLAKVGYERVQEIENPELGQRRTRALYKAKGYSEDWIEKRMRGIAIREELTDQWKKHGVERDKEYEILTAEISKATFGFTPSEYKKLKHLQRENLRDHMNDLELIFSMLGEAATTEITRVEDPLGFDHNREVSKRGGRIAGGAREKLEKETGEKVVSPTNYLNETQKAKKLKK
jgi:DNA-damage-inducible protein D